MHNDNLGKLYWQDDTRFSYIINAHSLCSVLLLYIVGLECGSALYKSNDMKAREITILSTCYICGHFLFMSPSFFVFVYYSH